jgi:hypothetical protein
MDRETILNEIKRTAEGNGGIPLGTARFFAETGIRPSDWEGKYWARWGDAVIEAGYRPNALQGSYDDKWVIEKLVAVVRKLGRFPTVQDLKLEATREKDFPSENVFTRHFGKKVELVKSTIQYCTRKGGYDDVLSICNAALVEVQPESRGTREGQPEYGFVYLMKSGKYYKIGRTTAVGRREYELGIQLPEKAATVHTIRTDDPPGIEAYWHNRFRDKRKNGEWFELGAEDVNAFKKRRFM